MGDEEPKEEKLAPAKKWKPGIGSILPVVALVMSLFSLYSSEVARRDVERVDVIKTEYGLFHDLAQLQLQNPMMEHLLTSSGEAYDSTVKQIRAALTSISEDDRGKLLLQERATAHYIFTSYEETFYIWRQSRGNDSRRAELAQDDLLYFDNLLCNNPRLLWYWNGKTGGKQAREFAPELGDYYKQNVLKDCPTSEDSNGPFGPLKGSAQ
jgi:hypothetical protein